MGLLSATVPSPALAGWSSRRSVHLDNLVQAHGAVSGRGRGRRWSTESTNWSLTLRLAAEFQGFVRDLHENTVDALIPTVSNPTIGDLIRNNFLARRYLDGGNASFGNIQQDFFRLGFSLGDLLEQRFGAAQKKDWTVSLDLLNKARNAVAHSDDEKFAEVKRLGFNPGTITAFKSARKRLNGLAIGMDDVIADNVATTLGSARPW